MFPFVLFLGSRHAQAPSTPRVSRRTSARLVAASSRLTASSTRAYTGASAGRMPRETGQMALGSVAVHRERCLRSKRVVDVPHADCLRRLCQLPSGVRTHPPPRRTALARRPRAPPALQHVMSAEPIAPRGLYRVRPKWQRRHPDRRVLRAERSRGSDYGHPGWHGLWNQRERGQRGPVRAGADYHGIELIYSHPPVRLPETCDTSPSAQTLSPRPRLGGLARRQPRAARGRRRGWLRLRPRLTRRALTLLSARAAGSFCLRS